MKMMEWFSRNDSYIAEAYKDINNYLVSDISIVNTFLNAIAIIEDMQNQGAFRHYDVWQMFKHTIAICNYINGDGAGKHESIALMNVVFEPEEDKIPSEYRESYRTLVEAEREGFLLFKMALAEAGVFEKMGKDLFRIEYLSAKEFIDCIKMDEAKRQYLKRYTFENM